MNSMGINAPKLKRRRANLVFTASKTMPPIEAVDSVVLSSEESCEGTPAHLGRRPQWGIDMGVMDLIKMIRRMEIILAAKAICDRNEGNTILKAIIDLSDREAWGKAFSITLHESESQQHSQAADSKTQVISFGIREVIEDLLLCKIMPKILKDVDIQIWEGASVEVRLLLDYFTMDLVESSAVKVECELIKLLTRNERHASVTESMNNSPEPIWVAYREKLRERCF